MANTDFHVRLPAARVMQQVVLSVELTGIRTWKVRLTLGVWLIKLAAFVMGCGVRVGLEQD